MRSRGETLNAPEPGVEAALLRVALGRDRRDRVLDVGCGSGRLRPVVTDLATEYVGADTDARVLRRARDAAVPAAGVSWATADAHHLPFRDASFSAVVVIRVYHRLSDPSAAFGEVARVLRPGGTLVLAVVPRSSVALFLRDHWMTARPLRCRVAGPSPGARRTASPGRAGPPTRTEPVGHGPKGELRAGGTLWGSRGRVQQLAIGVVAFPVVPKTVVFVA